MKKSILVIGGLLISIACFVIWGIAALDYGDNVATGTYRFERRGESSTLVLNPDRTFRQTRWLNGSEQHSEGTWRRVGKGGISFSKEFLVVSGDEPEPDGTTYSDLHKTLGLFVSLRLRQYHVLWYVKTDPANSILGTYTGDKPGVKATLALNADHSFGQTITRDGIVNHATGTWSQDSNGTIEFSKAFLKMSGAPLKAAETASSIDPKGSNLQVEISMSEHVTEPVFYKRLEFR
jgi:hypothetical protein